MSKVVVIGGGPAGMMAALAATKTGHEVLLLEKNEKLGKKLYITGKGRCNITNSGDMEDLFANVMTNSKFLFSAFYSYDNLMVMDFFEQEGLAIKNERGNRVFPVSDHSSDVINTLQRALKKAGVEVKLYTEVESILFEERADAEDLDKKEAHQIVKGVQLKSGLVDGKKTVMADAVIVATGGFSYQATGSTGDGYRFAREMGHTVTEIYPSLVPFNTKEEYVKEMQGLALKNVTVRIFDGKKKLYEDFGEMLFTHFGVSGPLLLSASAKISPKFTSKELQMEIDLKPALDEEQLDKRILKDFEEAKNKQFKNSIGKLFPTKMIPVILELSEIDPDKKVNEITREERASFVKLIKAFPVTLNGLRDFKEAIITKGGVKVNEINPSTMESKKVKNLYFCGEVLDLDALTGGYNLQIAWSTGHLAGISIE
ncbi:MAG: NAD(P)/FAD-dependent oxidoreductase [Lachnospiraceae bacterium]|nr:NAD(P)/FAD-dependent oxidoreductase [Lachnospiraceae bacterium]